MGDFVDKARQGWAQARPELEVSSIEVMGRIGRIGALTAHRAGRDLAPAGVTRAEFDVLCTLARAGSPVRASEVTEATMLSGAVPKNYPSAGRRESSSWAAAVGSEASVMARTTTMREAPAATT